MNIQLAKLLKYSKWYTTDKDNTAGLELDSITTTSSHGQMITKPTHFINESSSCINLNFSSNNCFVKNCQTMTNIIIISSTKPSILMYPSFSLITETFGITNVQILKVFKKLFQCLTGLRLSAIYIQMENANY